jgi:hypothetical protein
MSTDKRQFLDPISTISKMILLHFCPPKTKLSITNHTLQLVGESSYYDLITRNWNKNNRNDICFLFPMFTRFIRLYLIEKRKKIGKSYSPNNIAEHSMSEEEICYKYLKKIGEYSIYGLKELQKTYEYDNATFTLQYYISLIEAGVNEEFTDNLLPENLKELGKNNLLDDGKVLNIWENKHIIELGKTFEICFEAEEKKDQLILDSNKKKLMNILEIHDEKFKKMLETDSSI